MKVGDLIEYFGKVYEVFSIDGGKVRARRNGCIVVFDLPEEDE